MFQIPCASCLVGVLTLLAAQSTQSIPSTGRVSGRVIEDATHQPLPNARVFLYPKPFPVGSRPTSTMTNHDGAFAFADIPTGSYYLGTYKLGFLPPDVGMSLITLSDSTEQVSNVELMMSRGAALAGRVLDEAGRPLKGIGVGALRVIGLAELEQAIPSVSTTQTDDKGEYRLESLRPGQHVIVANPGHGPIGRAAGGITDSRTFFPGTLDFAEARRVTVAPAQKVTGLDFKMITAPTFDVSGIAIDGIGRAASNVVVELTADWSLFGGQKGSSRTDPGGQFRLSGITAGRYMLTVTSPGDNRKPVTRETRFIRIEIVDADISGLVVPVPIQ